MRTPREETLLVICCPHCAEPWFIARESERIFKFVVEIQCKHCGRMMSVPDEMKRYV